MPTFTFTRTREQLRDAILRKLGRLAIGQSVPSEHSTIVYEAMDLRLKELHAKDALWFDVSGAQTDVAMTQGSNTVALGANVLYPLTLAISVDGKDQPIDLVGHREFQKIRTKTETGQPTKALFSGGALYLWPVPNMNYTAKMTFQSVAADTAPATAPDVDTGMLRSFKNIVAYDLVDDFMLTNEAKIARMRADAEEGMKTILELNQQKTDNTTVTAEYF